MITWLKNLIGFRDGSSLSETDREKLEVLNRIKLFENTERDDLLELIKHTSFVDMEPGERIVEQGADATSLYMIESGEVGIRLKSNAEPVDRRGINDYFGEMGLLENRTRSAHVDCLKEGRVLKLSKRGFYSILQGQPETAVKFLFSLSRKLSRNLRDANERLRSENSSD